MPKQPKDSALKVMPVFTPGRVVSVTATEPWTPGVDDRVFACSALQGIKINGGTQGDWPEATPMGIAEPGVTTYTFSVTSTIFVM